MSNEDQPAAAPPAVSARTWHRVVLAAAVLAFVGAGAGTAFGLARSKDDGPRVTTQASPSDSATATPSDPAASASESQCTTDCPTADPGTGTRTTTVPHVVGHDEAGARSRVQGRGLNPQVKYVCQEAGTAGTVTAQSPKGDTQVNTGSKVSLDVRGASVLNVIGQYYGDAEGRLKEAGFTVSVINHRPGTAGGAVSSQSPSGNSCVKVGSKVTITVGQPTTSPSTNS